MIDKLELFSAQEVTALKINDIVKIMPCLL